MIYKYIHGWFDFESVYDEVVQHLGDGDHVAELGVWHGRSLVYLATRIKESGKNIHVTGIDHFSLQPAQSQGFHTSIFNSELLVAHPFYKEIKDRDLNPKEIAEYFVNQAGVQEYVTLLQSTTVEAASFFVDEFFKFIMVDAGHDHEQVKADMEAWWPKVVPGWYMAGHDYSSLFPGVIEAVQEFGKEKNLEFTLNNSVWFFRKPPID
jgi:cephalosporin hydroxylase